MASLKYKDEKLKVEADGDGADVIRVVKIGYTFRIAFRILAIVGAVVSAVYVYAKW